MDPNSGTSTGAALDSTNLNQFPTPDLIRFLLTSFRRSDYEEVARIIAAREQAADAELPLLRIQKIGVDLRCRNLERDCSSLLTRLTEHDAKVKGAESSLAAKASEIERLREHLERAEEELAIAREEEKRAKGEVKEWMRKYCEVEANLLKGFDANRELKEKIEALEKEKETRAWCRSARGDEDRNRCNGVMLEGRLGNGDTVMGNGGAGIVDLIEISDGEEDMGVKSSVRR